MMQVYLYLYLSVFVYAYIYECSLKIPPSTSWGKKTEVQIT